MIRRSTVCVCVLLLVAGCALHPRRHGRVSGAPPEPTPQPPLIAGTPRANAANAVLFRAIALVGTPYHWGGNTPAGGFDCSGLVDYVFRDAAGVGLPRTSADMSELGHRKLAVDSLQSGDLVFFAEGRQVSHVGIYVGKRRFVHAPNSGGTVRLDSIDGAWWKDHFVYGKRVFE